MKAVTTLLLLLSLGDFCSAQSKMDKTRVPYEDKCTDLAYCTDSLERKATFKDDLNKYVSKEISWHLLEKIRGIIVVQVSVDSAGNSCAKSFFNYTTNSHQEILDLWLNGLIANMPQWEPAISNGKPVNSIRNIALYCRVKGRKQLEAAYYDGIRKKVLVTNPHDSDEGKMIMDWDEVGKISGK